MRAGAAAGWHRKRSFISVIFEAQEDGSVYDQQHIKSPFKENK